MTDKPPTIYILNGSLQRLRALNVYTSTAIDVSMQQHAGASVAYEPRVGRCKTCCHYQSHLPHDLIRCVFLRTASDDEYCSNHIERRKP